MKPIDRTVDDHSSAHAQQQQPAPCQSEFRSGESNFENNMKLFRAAVENSKNRRLTRLHEVHEENEHLYG